MTKTRIVLSAVVLAGAASAAAQTPRPAPAVPFAISPFAAVTIQGPPPPPTPMAVLPPAPPQAPPPPPPPSGVHVWSPFVDRDVSHTLSPTAWASAEHAFVWADAGVHALTQADNAGRLAALAQQRAEAEAQQARAQAEQLESYLDQARQAIERSQYDRALQSLDRVILANGNGAEAAMYWKAYSLAKTARRPEALTTLADMQKQFPKGRWLNDARALEQEVRRASGQAVNAAAQDDEELKLLALSGLMQSDPETALPVIERMLAGSSSVRVKDRALFVVSQSKSSRARTLILGVAKGNSNPDLQLKAVRYIGQMGGTEAAQALDEVYRGTSDERIKREVIRGFGSSNSRDRLLALLKSETSPELRADAVRYLGNMGAAAELEGIYRSESSPDVKRRILQALQSSGSVDRLAAIARSETDPTLKRSAIQGVASGGRAGAADTLTAIYAADQSEDVRKMIIGALANNNSAAALVSLARNEKNIVLKQDIVRRLSNMRAPEARDYMLELLK